MGGQNAAEGHPVPRHLLYPRRSGDAVSPDIHGSRGKRGSGPGSSQPHPSPNGSGSLGAAQRRWPEYNRIIIFASIGAATAAIVISAVVQVIIK